MAKEKKEKKEVKTPAEKTPAAKVGKDGQKIRSLKVLGGLLEKRIRNKTTAGMEIGGLLAEAKYHFEKQKEMLEWAKDEFGIGRSQAYTYMSLYAAFGSEDRKELFANTGIKVLERLQQKPELIEQAALQLENNEITEVSHQWIEDQLSSSAQSEALEYRTPDSDDPTEDAAPLEDRIELDDETAAEVQELEDQLRALEEEKQLLAARLETVVGAGAHFKQLEKHLKKQTPWVILGIAHDAGKIDINKAKRSLEKVYSLDLCDGQSGKILELIAGAAAKMLEE